MTIEQAIIEQVRTLPPEKQQEVLAFIAFLNTDEWENTYKGRFQELQRDIQIGVDAADRGEVIDADDMFQHLRIKLQQKRDQVSS
jgi:antitoxin ParD1/3/4